MKRETLPELKAQAREVWRLSLPAILTQITTIAMQYIDSAMVGALGANASASIGLVSTSTWLIGGIIGGVSAGFSVQASHRIGGGDDRGARTVVRHGLVTGMLIAVILVAIAALISEPLPRWLHGDEAIRADACAYFLTFALMVPFSQLNSLCASFLQSAGDMVSPSVLNAVMCVLDVFFNALFIPRCGVFGAGLGTASACAVVSLLMAAQCLLRNPHLHMRRKEKDTVRGAILKKAFRIGFPVALQEVFLCAAMVVQTRIIAPLGAVAVAANSFAVTAEGPLPAPSVMRSDVYTPAGREKVSYSRVGYVSRPSSTRALPPLTVSAMRWSSPDAAAITAAASSAPEAASSRGERYASNASRTSSFTR